MNLDVDKTEEIAIASMIALSEKKILEIGCGQGWRTGFVARPDNQVTAIDCCPRSISAARRRLPQVSFIQGDIFQLEFVSPFDSVVFSRSLHHFPAGKQGKVHALSRAKQFCSAGGRILVIEPGLDGDSVKIAELFRPEKDEIVNALRAIMDCGLSILSQQAITVRQVFIDFEEFFRFFFSAECTDRFPSIVKKVKEVMQITDSNRAVHLTGTANLILLQ